MFIYTDDIWTRFGTLDYTKSIMEELEDHKKKASEFTDEEAYEFADNEALGDWEYLMECVRELDAKSPSYWIAKGDLGLWTVHHAGGKIFDRLYTAITEMTLGMDSVTINEDRRGNVTVKCTYHDSVYTSKIRRLNKRGSYTYEHSSVSKDLRTKIERLFKPTYSNSARLAEAIGWW